MIALCPTHHNFADGGIYTKDNLYSIKRDAPNTPLAGSLPWQLSNVLIIFGGNYFVTNMEKEFQVRIDNDKLFSLQRSLDGYLKINANLHDANGNLVCKIENNDIMSDINNLGDLIFSAQGNEIKISSKQLDTRLFLRFDRKSTENILLKFNSTFPKNATNDLRLKKIQNVRDYIKSASDSENMCPTISIHADIFASTMPIRTLRKGIVLDGRKIGYDKAVICGFDIGTGGLGFVLHPSQHETFFMGSE